MIKHTLILCILIIGIQICPAQEKIKIYNPEEDANSQLDQAIKQAKLESKHVLVQVGGNWCPWCIRFHQFIHENATIDSILKADYVFVLINYSKENPKSKNPEVMKRLSYPNRFGFPVLVVLNENGERIHTQNSAYLEEGKSYAENKVKEFLLQWNPKAINPDTYKE